MTSAEMLARVGVLVDETPATDAFYNPTDIYRFLTDGQYQVADYFVNLYRKFREAKRNINFPFPLQPLLKSYTRGHLAGVSIITLPADYWEYISLLYRHDGETLLPVRIRPYDGLNHFLEQNAYAAGTDTDYWARVLEASAGFKMSIEVKEAGYSQLNYIKIPPDITALVNPTLQANTHDAIVLYAAALMMIKDERFAESNNLMQQYIAKLSTVEVYGNVNP